jgi:mannose-6-phosphate isomerase-like protein (cupin superfamily)
MRRSASLHPSCLLGLVTSIALLGIGQLAPIPAIEVALGSGSREDLAAATTDTVRIDEMAPSRPPTRRGDEGASRGRRDDAMVRPLAELSLFTAPTAAGASLLAERLTYAPGAANSKRRYTQVRVVSLEAGSLAAHIDGVAFLDRRWPAGSLLAREPHRVEGVVHLHPGDLLVVPAEAAFTARNLEELAAVSLEVSVQLPQPLTAMTDRVRTGTGSEGVHSEHLMSAIATEPGVSVAVAVASITQPPGESIVLDGTAGQVLVALERAILGTSRESFEIEDRPGDLALVGARERATVRSNGKDPLAILLITLTPLETDNGV